MLGSFASSVEESFTKAQARAQEISAALAASTKGTASTVAGQFEMIRENAGREREKTAQALQSAYDQASAQLSQIMDQAAEKFRQSVAEVKGMAGEMQRELDGTRHEMRRGVLELPQETQEAANAMRRVVSDQIKALKELAAVVSASGASFDIAEPAPPTAPSLRAESHPLAPRRGSAARGRSVAVRPVASRPSADGTLGQRGGARALAAPPRPPLRHARTTRSASLPRWRRSNPFARARRRSPPPSRSPSASTAEQRTQTGWLSNLLAAASREEPQTPPQRAASSGALEPSPPRAAIGGPLEPLPPRAAMSGSLESISLDIARLVDTEAASEMWERWRAGDTTAVSRRLYTAAGQQTFDDLRRRYRSDTAFRDSVDRYVKEFERLLAKIGQNDRDGSQSRVAMLSDSGKVYIMLAHASGRLG